MKNNFYRPYRLTHRLENYDYSKEGLYFITISVQSKLCLFGEIKNNELNLFDSGKMINEHWLDLENQFENIKLHDFITMPNHFHGVIEIIKKQGKCSCILCRDTPCGYPMNEKYIKYQYNIQKNYFHMYDENNDIQNHNPDTHKGCPYNRQLLGNIIGSFKSKTTHNYIQNVRNNNRQPFNKKLWQKNFYDNIIRDEKQYNKIIKYIEENPYKWEEDKFYYTEI